jgi:acid phosphatase family membrane protein YuiD
VGYELLDNQVLLGTLISWALAQILKLPLAYLRTGKWKWVLLLRAGGMPSSHSALIASTTHGIGLVAGFDTPLFALGVAIAMIVIYDATGIRRQAGRHAVMINTIMRDLLEGQPLRHRDELIEVLGHSPAEAIAGLLLGMGIAQVLDAIMGS